MSSRLEARAAAQARSDAAFVRAERERALGKNAKLCSFCGCPMKPRGVKKRPNEYDHAQGCPYSSGLRTRASGTAKAVHLLLTRRAPAGAKPGTVGEGRWSNEQRITVVSPLAHEWLMGFGLALSEVWYLRRDDETIRAVMRVCGVTLSMLKAAGLDGFDLKRLRKVKGVPR